MKSADINRIFGIQESFQLPDVLLHKILNEDMTPIYNQFMQLGESLNHDWFTEYFEEEHANKSKMAQDFTPPEVCGLLSQIIEKAGVIADVCAGTGGLTIGVWNHNKSSKFICYELSSRAIPLLLFNLSIRNLNAVVYRADLLTGETFETYEVTPSEHFSNVRQVAEIPQIKVNAVISNPPYSMKYNPKNDNRFEEYKDMLPTNYAEFVFVAFALSILKDKGKCAFILPHGVLFRSNKEKKFRQLMLQKNLIRTIIGLPNKLFINTDIPTCVIEIEKGRTDSDVYFIDAKDEAENVKPKNIIRDKNLTRIIDAYKSRTDIKRFTHVATFEEIEKNESNLNIPRYVDTYIPEPIPDFVETMQELAMLEDECFKTKKALLDMIRQMHGTTFESDSKLKKGIREYKQSVTSAQRKWKQEVLEFEFDN